MILAFYQRSMLFLVFVVLLIAVPPVALIAATAVVTIWVIRAREERAQQACWRESLTWQPAPPVEYQRWNTAAVHPAYDEE